MRRPLRGDLGRLRLSPARRARPLVAGVVHAIVAASAAGGLSVVLAHRAGVDGTGTAATAWGYVVDGAGLAAVVWAYAGLVLGLALGGRLPHRLRRHRAAVSAVHRQLDLAVIALVLVHALATVWATPAGSFLTAFVPQTADVAPWGWTLGILSFYLMLVLGPSWYLRARIGRRTWLVAHQLAAVTYALGVWHTLLLGSDVAVEGPVRTAFWIAQVPLLGLFALRLWRPHRAADGLDVGRRAARFAAGPHRTLRVAVLTGVLVAATVVLAVALAAAGEGEHATRVPGSLADT